MGREDGVVIGQTFATIGLLTGLFGGIACINYATRKGATRLVDKAESLPQGNLNKYFREQKHDQCAADQHSDSKTEKFSTHVHAERVSHLFKRLLCAGPAFFAQKQAAKQYAYQHIGIGTDPAAPGNDVEELRNVQDILPKLAPDCAVFVGHGKYNELHDREEAEDAYKLAKEPKALYYVEGKHNEWMFDGDPKLEGLCAANRTRRDGAGQGRR